MKEKLSACVTSGDSHKLFSSWEKDQLNNFINALKKAKEYIDLTMRDDFLLQQAQWVLSLKQHDFPPTICKV